MRNLLSKVFFVLIGLGSFSSCTQHPEVQEPVGRQLKDYSFERTSTRRERGRYLVAIAQCLNCHSPIDPILLLPIPGKEGSRGILDSRGLIAPNITPDSEKGAGRWTDDMFVRAIREGFGHDGRPLHSAMPSDYYSVLTDEDVASIVVYLRSLAPLKDNDAVAAKKWLTGQRGAYEEEMSSPAKPESLLSKVASGAYLVRIAMCEHCHSPFDSLGNRMAGLRFAGGTPFDGDSDHVTVSSNLTRDSTGISHYDASLLRRALRSGLARNGRELNPWMPWPYFRGMTDDDIRAVYEYLKTQPSVRHFIDNTEHPRRCKLCGTSHGLGDLN